LKHVVDCFGKLPFNIASSILSVENKKNVINEIRENWPQNFMLELKIKVGCTFYRLSIRGNVFLDFASTKF